MVDDIRNIFNAPDCPIANRHLVEMVKKCEVSASRLANEMGKNRPERLTIISFPPAHRRLICTNGVELLNHEIKLCT
jgi:transposase-like protein